MDLPNYGVFDEKRLFVPGPVPGPITIKGIRVGIPICEDIWGPDVVECVTETGGEILLVPNGSPYWRGKIGRPAQHCGQSGRRVRPAARLPQQVGGQDELVFDGVTFALNADRSVAFQLPDFRETVVTTHWSRTQGVWRCTQGPIAAAEEPDQADYTACMVGLRDYVEKNGFKGVVLGLSGGIDSALCRGARDRRARRRSRTLRDAAVTASPRRTRSTMRRRSPERSAFTYDVVPIESAVGGLEATLADVFAGAPRDVTEENLQARARGTILMAISNKFGLMVVTTGNKSEMSVGYATLYGDMNGGFNPIKDLYKTEVFRLARLRNRWKPEGALGPIRARSFPRTC